MSAAHSSEETEELPLSKAVEFLVEECRMVLPGIQALFGFQLIAVFNSSFAEKLSPGEQRLHLLAIALVGVAIAIIMTPAAYHRQTGPRQVSRHFINLSTRLLLWSMAPLALAVSLEFYLISRIILDGVLAPLLAAGLFVVFLILWFALPRVEALQRAASDRRES
jgi:Family of unknown function (DUF6328)